MYLEIASKLNSLSPTNVMLRGYSVVFKDGNVVSSAKRLKKGDEINIKLSDGDKKAEITN